MWLMWGTQSPHLLGDRDPLDVVEIGDAVGHVGQIKQVKALGVLAMIDEGETDWKVIAIDVTDPHAAEMNGMKLFRLYFIHTDTPICFYFGSFLQSNASHLVVLRYC